MAPWVLENTSPSLGRTYLRPLDLNEHGFWLDSCFNGTANFIYHFEVETKKDVGEKLFQEGNVSRTWSAVKQRFPLLGAQLRVYDIYDATSFVVSEKLLKEHVPGQLTFQSISSADEALNFIDKLLGGPQRNFAELPVRIFILKRTDEPTVHHVLIDTVHVVGDAMSSFIFHRIFFDILTSSSFDIGEVLDLQERLAMVPAAEDLYPIVKMSKARQRWRRAIAHIIYHNRAAQSQGGHALPRTITPMTYRTPARKGRLVHKLSVGSSSVILNNCRKHDLTFGAAVTVLGQIAITRVLYRRHLRGEISEEEWEYRKVQPVHSGGPMSLRPYLDKEWLALGGASAVFLCISYFRCKLPFMPTVPHPAKELLGGAPSFRSLMSFERFLLHCNSIKKQMDSLLKHPLILEMLDVHLQYHVAFKRRALAHWHAIQRGEELPEDDAPEPINGDPLVPGYGWSSIGNVDTLFPLAYPLPATHSGSHLAKQSTKTSPPLELGSPAPGESQRPGGLYQTLSHTDDGKPILHVRTSETHLHPRASELYLVTSTSCDHLRLQVNYDRNVYEPALVEEWVEEVKAAAEWYLGRDTGKIRGKL